MIKIKISDSVRQEMLELLYKDAKKSRTGLLVVLENKANKKFLENKYKEIYNLFYINGKINEHEVKKLLAADRNVMKEYIKKLGCYDKKKSDELQEKIFRYKNFSNRDITRNILKQMNIQVCPYCNRQYIVTLKNKKVRPQFDHYYPKSEYPYLSLSLFNLVPCCSICNMAKSNLNTDKKPILYPYEEEFGYDIRFSIEVNDKTNLFKYASGNSDEFSVKIKNYNNILVNEVKQQIQQLHLEELYNEHKDYVKDILRHNYIYTDKRIKEIYDSFSGLFESLYDVENTIHMSYLEKEDWGKRPLSKLTSDIFQDIQKKKL